MNPPATIPPPAGPAEGRLYVPSETDADFILLIEGTGTRADRLARFRKLTGDASAAHRAMIRERNALQAERDGLLAALAELLTAQDQMETASDYLPGLRSRRLAAARTDARAALAETEGV